MISCVTLKSSLPAAVSILRVFRESAGRTGKTSSDDSFHIQPYFAKVKSGYPTVNPSTCQPVIFPTRKWLPNGSNQSTSRASQPSRFFGPTCRWPIFDVLSWASYRMCIIDWLAKKLYKVEIHLEIGCADCGTGWPHDRLTGWNQGPVDRLASTG